MLYNHRSNQHECLIVLKYRVRFYPLQRYNHFSRFPDLYEKAQTTLKVARDTAFRGKIYSM